MKTAQMSAQTLIDRRAAGREFSERNLKNHRERLEASFVMKVLKEYRNDLPGVFHKNSQFLAIYPGLINRVAHTIDKVNGIDKKSKILERVMITVE